FHDAYHSSGHPAAGHAKSRSRTRSPGAAPLATGPHDSSDATLGRSIHGDLVASTHRESHAAWRRRPSVIARRQSGPGRIHHAPRAPHLCVSRAENVEAILAEPRSSDVYLLFRHRRALLGMALVPVSWE